MKEQFRLLADPEGMHTVFLRRAVHEAFGTWASGSLEHSVDFGCGNCPFQREIDRISRKVTTVDIGDNPLATMRIVPGERLPLDDRSADLVVSFQVLEHVRDYVGYLNECARICRPGGWLLLSVPSVWPFHPHPEDYRRWMLPGLQYDLAQAGFDVEQHWPILNAVSTVFQYLLSVCRYGARSRAPTRVLARCLALALNPLILITERLFSSSSRFGGGNYLVKARRRS